MREVTIGPQVDTSGGVAILNHMAKYSATLTRTFDALSDDNRRRIVERLTAGPASITELAQPLGLSLPGLLKHVRILEEADVVRTTKEGRTRYCHLDPGQMDGAVRWIDEQRKRWERRIDRLETHIEQERKGGRR
jgi:DNA-binding transcriptional ArsR family regulator